MHRNRQVSDYADHLSVAAELDHILRHLPVDVEALAEKVIAGFLIPLMGIGRIPKKLSRHLPRVALSGMASHYTILSEYVAGRAECLRVQARAGHIHDLNFVRRWIECVNRHRCDRESRKGCDEFSAIHRRAFLNAVAIRDFLSSLLPLRTCAIAGFACSSPFILSFCAPERGLPELRR